MNKKDLGKFRELLIRDGKAVSEIERTSGNYDNDGNLIEGELPTVTTDFCEVGLYDDDGAYFVFVVESKTFDLGLLEELKKESDISIYGFVDFNENLYPVSDFNEDKFFKQVKKDKYLQIQFDFEEPETEELYGEYCRIVELLKNSNVKVVNQIEIDLIGDKN
ncbi:hypothetical protein ACFL08_04945 [Patescibacteria group bacterium]